MAVCCSQDLAAGVKVLGSLVVWCSWFTFVPRVSFTKFFRCCSSARSSGVQKVSFVEGIGEGVGRKTAWLKKMSRARSAGLNEDLVLDGNWGASSVLVCSPPYQSRFRHLGFCVRPSLIYIKLKTVIMERNKNKNKVKTNYLCKNSSPGGTYVRPR